MLFGCLVCFHDVWLFGLLTCRLFVWFGLLACWLFVRFVDMLFGSLVCWHADCLFGLLTYGLIVWFVGMLIGLVCWSLSQ